jgi:hypothetical protein
MGQIDLRFLCYLLLKVSSRPYGQASTLSALPIPLDARQSWIEFSTIDFGFKFDSERKPHFHAIFSRSCNAAMTTSS